MVLSKLVQPLTSILWLADALAFPSLPLPIFLYLFTCRLLDCRLFPLQLVLTQRLPICLRTNLSTLVQLIRSIFCLAVILVFHSEQARVSEFLPWRFIFNLPLSCLPTQPNMKWTFQWRSTNLHQCIFQDLLWESKVQKAFSNWATAVASRSNLHRKEIHLPAILFHVRNEILRIGSSLLLMPSLKVFLTAVSQLDNDYSFCQLRIHDDVRTTGCTSNKWGHCSGTIKVYVHLPIASFVQQSSSCTRLASRCYLSTLFDEGNRLSLLSD